MFALNQELGANINAGLPDIKGSLGVDVATTTYKDEQGRTVQEGTVWPISEGSYHIGDALFKGPPRESDYNTGRIMYTGLTYLRNNQLVSDSIGFTASRDNPIYGASNTVQPPAYTVTFFRRIS